MTDYRRRATDEPRSSAHDRLVAWAERSADPTFRTVRVEAAFPESYAPESTVSLWRCVAETRERGTVRVDVSPGSNPEECCRAAIALLSEAGVTVP